MSDVIEANPESIRELSSELRSSVSAMSGTLEALTGELDFLMTLWSGEAASAYLRAQEGWNDTMRDFNEVLFQATQLLAGVASRYETTENDIVALCGA